MADPDTADPTALALRQLGARLREIRVAADLTQEQLSGATGIDYKRIQRIEAGTVNVTMRTLVRLAAALQCSLRDLFGE